MGLSRLQKTILKLALRDQGRYFTPAAVKAVYYGFPLRPRGPKLLFDKAEIGPDRYNSAAVAISHAFDHLARKGFVERVPGRGVTLTESGREKARQVLND